MYETLEDRLLIDPDDRELRHFAQWVKRQGDGRGFIVTEYGRPDPYLILFDSYGRTHHSVVMELNMLRNYRCEALIFRLSGNVYSDIPYRPRQISTYVQERVYRQIQQICRMVNADNGAPVFEKE